MRRHIVNWDLRESMTEGIILERAKEFHPDAQPRIISDNGPQFIAKDFKEFIRISRMATAVQNAAQVIERPADIDVRHVNVPVQVSRQRLLKARALLRRLAAPT